MSEASKPVEEQQLPIRKISDKLVDSITDKPWLEIVQETKTQLKMEKTAASLKKELSIESEQASKKVLIKVSSSCETIDFLIKNAEQKLKKEGDEEQKESIFFNNGFKAAVSPVLDLGTVPFSPILIII